MFQIPNATYCLLQFLFRAPNLNRAPNLVSQSHAGVHSHGHYRPADKPAIKVNQYNTKKINWPRAIWRKFVLPEGFRV